MKKIFLILVLMFYSQIAFCMGSDKNYSIHFNGQKYNLLYSVKSQDFGGYLNEYYKQGETYNIWSEMVAVHHFPNAYSPIDRIRDFKDYLSSMQVPSSLTFDDKNNSAMIDFIIITSNKMPVVLEFNIFKYGKSKKCGSVAVQYVKRYAATTTMQIEEIKKEFEKNRKPLIKKVKNFKIPEVVAYDIDKCISGAELKKQQLAEYEKEKKVSEKETAEETIIEEKNEIVETSEEPMSNNEITSAKEPEKAQETELKSENEKDFEEVSLSELDKNNKEDIEEEILNKEKEPEIINNIKEEIVAVDKKQNIIPISEKSKENLPEKKEEFIEIHEIELSFVNPDIKKEAKPIENDKKAEPTKLSAPIPNVEQSKKEENNVVKKQNSGKKKDLIYNVNNNKDEFYAKARTKKELKEQAKLQNKQIKSKKTKVQKTKNKTKKQKNKDIYVISNNNFSLIATPRSKKEMKKYKQELKALKKAKEKAKKTKEK